MIRTEDVKAICLDLDGTLFQGIVGPAFEGAVDAVRSLRREYPIRFVTNAVSMPLERFRRELREAGVLEDDEELVTPAVSARKVLGERGHDRGMLLTDRRCAEDFEWFTASEDGPAVLLATESLDLSLRDLQPVFRALLGGAHLYALQMNRYYRKGEELVTDLGPLARFLSYAADCEVEVLGKPSPLLYDGIARELGVERRELLVVGDDAEFDVSASVRLGMQAALVRTGKYREGDEARLDPAPTAVIDSAAELPRVLAARLAVDAVETTEDEAPGPLNRAGWDAESDAYQRRHGDELAQTAMAWGVWRIPEEALEVLGDVAGRDVLEYGCGAAQWSIALAERDARVVGMDLSEVQLRHARRRCQEAGSPVRLVQADAEACPFPDESFDLVFCDHGAMTFARPEFTVAEAARVLRPGGELVFCHSSPLRDLCWDPEKQVIGPTLRDDYFRMHRIDDEEDSVCYQLPYGQWIWLFRDHGLVVEGLIELQPEPGAQTSYADFVPLEWARRWPAEGIWRLRKPSVR